MLAKKFRLPSSLVFRHARIIRTPEFTVKVQMNTLSHNRYAFVVAKKVDKKATVRNRLKRVVRSFLEEKWLGKTKGHDMLFIVRPVIKSLPRETIGQQVDDIMKKL